MERSNDSIHSFIVRVWLEEDAEGDRPAVWRGHVTHAVSRERVYISDLREILPIILSQLPQQPAIERTGGLRCLLGRLCRWLRRPLRG
jgi:hypothetical protein